MPAPKHFKARPGSKSVRSFYRPRCAVCQYLKKDPEFRARVMGSKYFNPAGKDSLMQVVIDAGSPFPMSSVYMHMQRHQESDLARARKRYSPKTPQILPHPQDLNNPNSTTPLANAALVNAAVETDVSASTEHELALDEMIRAGRQKILTGELNFTATNYLQAIKIKSDNEKNTKDRRMEMIKSFFGTKPE